MYGKENSTNKNFLLISGKFCNTEPRLHVLDPDHITLTPARDIRTPANSREVYTNIRTFLLFFWFVFYLFVCFFVVVVVVVVFFPSLVVETMYGKENSTKQKLSFNQCEVLQH